MNKKELLKQFKNILREDKSVLKTSTKLSEATTGSWNPLTLPDIGVSASTRGKKLYRLRKFKEMMLDPQADFILTDGTVGKIQAANNLGFVDAIDKEVAGEIGAVKTYLKTNSIVLDSGASIQLGDIAKSGAFGGRGAGSGTSAETAQIADINSAIKTAGGGGPIDIVVGTGGFNKTGLAIGVVKMEQVSGTPKADGKLVNSAGEAVAYISLKAAATPKDMNQWGGISRYASHPEIATFIKEVDAWVTKNGRIPRGKSLVCELKDQVGLGLDVTFGDGKKDADNCDLIIATGGAVTLEPSGNNFKFNADHVWYARTPISLSGWKPALYARFGDRNDFGVKYTRFGAFPYDYRVGDKKIILPYCSTGGGPNDEEVQEESTLTNLYYSLLNEASFSDLLKEELTRADKKEIKTIARKEALKEIERVVGKDFSKTIQEEIKKSLGQKATKQEVAEISKQVLKKLYREMSHSYNPLIDRIKL